MKTIKTLIFASSMLIFASCGGGDTTNKSKNSVAETSKFSMENRIGYTFLDEEKNSYLYFLSEKEVIKGWLTSFNGSNYYNSRKFNYSVKNNRIIIEDKNVDDEESYNTQYELVNGYKLIVNYKGNEMYSESGDCRGILSIGELNDLYYKQ
jgi:hypothetical protein